MSNNELTKKMPISINAEQALLGSLLIDPSLVTDVVSIVQASDFYVPEHRAIYSAMISLATASHDIDVVTLMNQLQSEKTYDSRESAEAYLKTLTDAVPDALNVNDYARIVIEKSVMRQLIDVCGTVSERAYADGENPDDLVAYAAAEISNIAVGRNSKSFQEISQVILKVYKTLETLAQDPTAFDGIKTGFGEVDRYLGGINSTDFVLIGARPGMGKTSFALNVATNVAKNTGKKVAIFSLEMSAEQLASRILSSQALVESSALRTGALTDQDWDRLATAVDWLVKTKILIDDSTNVTVSGMKAKLRREKDLGLVVIDYLGLMQGERHLDNRVLEISDITRNLKLMAKELNVPVICCSQLSRGVENRNAGNKRPMLSDLRDSGSIEQDADSVMFIYRDKYYENEGNKKENSGEPTDSDVAEIIIAKNRHGGTGTAHLGWIGKFTAFRARDNEHDDRDAPPDYSGGSY